MSKIIILKDSALAQTDELITLLKNNKNLEIIELQDCLVSALEDIAQKNQTVLIALGNQCELGWNISNKINAFKAIILIHPQVLSNYLTMSHQHPCMIIHSPQNSFITPHQLTAISRPRPDIAQFISSSHNILEYQQEIFAFMQQYLQAPEEAHLTRIIRDTDIMKMLPAPNPGAIRILEENKVTVGIVVPDKNPPFEHINPGYKNEIHFVVSGTALFRHGSTNQKVLVNPGDFVYVKAFEKHEWTDWSDDFKLIFMQWEIE
ncbi:cupin domain-containing protein [Legionella sainthelensi]|uniref:Cupin domain-containing protein n=1 Tax=Legionella sainthelensi TaxID=28087 RepID=A0A2H5FR06_9GAMM|nr:cupin domain-containing protein [Legionella sainthelensi]AUH73943.1 cupin domain-containing protein [Legionella sainthelensi]